MGIAHPQGWSTMKLPIPCLHCMNEAIASRLPPEETTTTMPIATVEFRDDGRYESTCPKGHKSITILQQQKFEVLFDIGAYAIADGYYREAVSSSTSCLERFYEFFIKAVLFEKGLEEDTISVAWKPISKQSERQLGAFIFLYTSEFGIPPKLLIDFINSRSSFRNDVIHKGKIPSRQEAVKYGQAVLDVIRPILRETKEKYPNGVNKTKLQHLDQCRRTNDKDQPVTTTCISTIISLLYPAESGHYTQSLEKAIADLKKWT